MEVQQWRAGAGAPEMPTASADNVRSNTLASIQDAGEGYTIFNCLWCECLVYCRPEFKWHVKMK